MIVSISYWEILKWNIPICVLITLAYSGILSSQPQTYLFESMDQYQALPDSRSIIQDDKGFLWFATHDGVWRYDGYELHSYKYNRLDSNGLSGSTVSAIFEDRFSRIWVATLGGSVDRSNKQKNEFENISKRLSSPSFRIYKMMEDRDHNVWIAGDKGLTVINLDDEDVITPHVSFAEQIHRGLQSSVVYDIYEDHEGVIWIASNSGLYSYDPVRAILHAPSEANAYPRRPVLDIEVNKDNDIWLSTRGGEMPFYFLEADSNKFKQYTPLRVENKNSSIRFCFDEANQLWYAPFGDGIRVFDLTKREELMHSRVNSNYPYLRYFRNPYVDKIGNIWVAADGILKYSFSQGFCTYLHNENFDQSSSSIDVGSEKLYGGYRDGGLVIQDKYSQNYRLYESRNLNNQDGLLDPITNTMEISDNEVLVAGVGGVQYVNPLTNVVKTYPIPGSIRYLFEDKRGRIWISGQYHLLEFDKERGIIAKHNFENPKNGAAFFQTIVEDSQNRLWIATDGNGLCMFDPDDGSFVRYTPDNFGDKGLLTWRMNDLTIDRYDNLWIGSDVGLLYKKKGGGNFDVYDESNGIDNSFIASVIYYDQDEIWVSTNDGIAAFSPQSEKFKNYNSIDGLGNSFYFPRVRDVHGDSLYFGGRKGIDFFNPNDLRQFKFDPSIVIEEVRVGNDSIVYSADILDSAIELSYKVEFISVKYIGLNFPSSDNIRYAYRIRGIIEEWSYINTEREVLLTGLDPGDYVFEVMAYDKRHPDQAVTQVLALFVKPPIWDTVYFKIAIMLGALSLLYLFVKWRERTARKREKTASITQRMIHDLERKALMSQMNPHFIFNAINSIQEFILLGNKDSSLKYLNMFSRLVRQVLNYSDQDKIPLIEELDLIRDYLDLELVRFPDKFEYGITVDPNLDIYTIEIPPFLIQPQIENAIKHGFRKKKKAGQIDISLRSDESNLVISIEDNGIGRKDALQDRSVHYERAGMGLSITKQRLEILNRTSKDANLRIDDLYSEGQGVGTRVTITIPLEF